MKKFVEWYDNHSKGINVTILIILIILLVLPLVTYKNVYRDREYTQKEDVARYIIKFHELPVNYVTEHSKGNLYKYHGSKSNIMIGGDNHFMDADNEVALEKYIHRISNSTPLKECDVKVSADDNYTYQNRGCNKLVYTTHVFRPRVFFTDNHYGTGRSCPSQSGYARYEEVSTFKLQFVSNICWIVFAGYLGIILIFYLILWHCNKKVTGYDEDEV